MLGLFNKPELSVLVVCKANVCRSPMAQGLLELSLQARGLGKRVRVDSAGTSAGQLGRRPDPRAQQVCQLASIDISRVRARQFKTSDFTRFDFILAVDARSHEWLIEQLPPLSRAHLLRMGEWRDKVIDVPDPYYGNLNSFEVVFTTLNDLMADFVSYLECQLAHKTT